MLAGEVPRLDASRVMVIASAAEAGRAEQVVTDLPVVHRHDKVVMHVPVGVAERARTAAITSTSTSTSWSASVAGRPPGSRKRWR